jgi:hypothetical protein
MTKKKKRSSKKVFTFNKNHGSIITTDTKNVYEPHSRKCLRTVFFMEMDKNVYELF